jgi:type I restriction enzyme S subunit
MSDWKKYKLGDVGRIVTGKTPPTKDSENFGSEYPFITPRDMNTQKFIRGTERYLSEKAKIQLKNNILPEKAICVSCIGSDLGKVVMTSEESFTNQQLNSIICSKKFNPDFIYYTCLILSNKIRSIGKSSTAVPIVNKSQFSDFEFEAPENIEEQTQIAQILSSLDDKIELNLQMNQTLEAMAQAIFKEWFVNFNSPNSLNYGSDDLPDGCDNKKSGKSSNQKNQGSDNGLPKGWRMGKLGEVLQPKKGKNITKTQAIEGDFPVVAGGLEPSCFHNESNTNEPVVTISSSGANAGFVRLYQTKVWSSDSCFIDNTVYPFVYYCYLFLKYNQKNIYDSQEGSAQPHIYPRHIMDLNTFIGNEKIVKYFDEIVKPIFEKIKYNSLQIQSLTQTRDTLLPKLMSGALEVESEKWKVESEK